LKCECKVIVDDININDLNKFKKKIYKNFYDVLKNSNYKVMKCYRLVFNLGHFKKNIGSIMVLCFFILYAFFFMIYVIKGISPLQEESLKNIYENKDVELKNNNKPVIFAKKKKRKSSKNINKEIINFPPKKKKSVIKKVVAFNEQEKKKKRKSHLPFNNKKNKNINESSSHTNIQLKKSKTKIFSLKNSESKSKINLKGKKKNEKEKDDIKENKKLDDLDLNNSKYEIALESDKRTLFQIYWSRLKTRHLIIYTFISCHDYNLLYIKISRFIFLFCTSMALNVFFFFDSSIIKFI
jgi:hypothetical protein